MDTIVVAQFGQIHPEVAAARKLRQDVFLAEFDLEQLYALGSRRIHFRALAKFPAVERDFSFIFSDEVPFIEMKKTVWNLDIKEVRDMYPVEIFRGGSIAPGKYSILLRTCLQSPERTLREDELAQWSGSIVAALTALGGVQRA
jgi:phenylalanyl-tRNA synthetase beta chain